MIPSERRILDCATGGKSLTYYQKQIWDLVTNVVKNARYLDPDSSNISNFEATANLLEVKAMLKQLVNA